MTGRGHNPSEGLSMFLKDRAPGACCFAVRGPTADRGAP